MSHITPNFEFSAAPETHFKSILKLGGGGGFNYIRGLDHSGSEPFNYSMIVISTISIRPWTSTVYLWQEVLSATY